MFFSIVESNMSILMIDLPAERARIFHDLKLCTYSFSVYYLARWITDNCYIIISSLLYLSIVVLLVGMRNGFLVVFVGTLEVMTACGLATFIASLASSPQIALLVLQPVQLTIAQFSGFFINVHTIPLYIKWLQYFSYMYYGFKLILISQWHNVVINCANQSVYANTTSINSGPNNPCTPHFGNDILRYYGANPYTFNFYLMLMLILGGGFYLAGYLINLVRVGRTV